jgi:hypothetical protein
MASSAKTAPPNSLVLVADDPSRCDIPETMAGSLIAATSSCIAVGCRSEVDDETEFTLGATREVDPGDHPAFEGVLKTPHRKIAIRSVFGQTILEAPVRQEQTTVRVWVNDPKEPDRVTVGIG